MTLGSAIHHLNRASSGGSVEFPSTLSLSGWWRDYPGAAPWTGQTSAGTSSTNSLTSVGKDPSAGTALNTHGTANFNGTTNNFAMGASAPTNATYMTATVFCGWILLKPTDFTGIKFLYYGGDIGQVVFISNTIGNASFKMSTSATVTRAAATGVYQLITFRYDGTNVQVGVNEAPGASGGGSTSAFSTAIGITGTPHFGDDNAASGPYTGLIAEIGLSKSILSDANFTSIKSYINSRYGLAL